MVSIIIIVIVGIAVLFWAFLQQPQFGARMKGLRLERIKRSPNFKNGTFQNEQVTPMFTGGANYFNVSRKFFFGKNKRSIPSHEIPSVKTDLKNFSADQNVIVWFGHSSYFIQVDGKKILVDPVFSGNASPIGNFTKSFRGSDVYQVIDLPEIDYLFITHDHYDHLDYKTLIELKPKVKKIITGLGVGAHLEKWGYDTEIITELDWNEHAHIDDRWRVDAASARHFSGRSFSRNKTLWVSFVLTTPKCKIYIGGDSGYGDHFKRLGDQFGPFDLVILENGQYNEYWKYIHMMPEEVVQASIDLKAKKLLPVHWSKFSLSLHDWDEPILRVVKEADKNKIDILHPRIGEAVPFKENVQTAEWWKDV